MVLPVLVLPGPAFAAEGAELDYAAAINMAGRQRMLSQRITKSYLLVGLGANTAHSQAQLHAAIDRFESQLNALGGFAPGGETGSAINKVRTLWEPFRDKALVTPDRAEAEKLARMDEELLLACEHVVQLLEETSGSHQGWLVNISGRQRMLSQRLAKFYMVIAAGMGTPAVLKEIQIARTEFREALDILSGAEVNTVAIRDKLKEVGQQWIWLESALNMQKDSSYPLIVADASEKILVLMESLTAMYASLDESGNN
jgi:nitrate/nitrite-specific signal transduction histidine kinase